MTRTWTCNVIGNVVDAAKAAGFHAYHANGTTAIEIPAPDKATARRKAGAFGQVAHVFE